MVGVDGGERLGHGQPVRMGCLPDVGGIVGRRPRARRHSSSAGRVLAGTARIAAVHGRAGPCREQRRGGRAGPGRPDDVDPLPGRDRTGWPRRREPGPDLRGAAHGHAGRLRAGDPLEEHPQGRLRAAPLVGGAVARPQEPADVRRAQAGDGDVDQADGLRLAAAVGAGDTRDRHPEVGPERVPDAIRHRERDLRGHRPVGREHLGRNAQDGALHVVRVRDDAAPQVGRGARHLRDQVGDEAAGAGFRGGQGHAASHAAAPESRGEGDQRIRHVRCGWS